MNVVQFVIMMGLPDEFNADRSRVKREIQEFDKTKAQEMKKMQDKDLKRASLMLTVREIASAVDKETLFTAIIKVLEKGLDAEAVDIFLIDRIINEGFLVKSSHKKPGSLKFPLSEESLIAKSARDSLFIIRSRAKTDAMLSGLLNKGEIPCTVCLPLLKGKEVMGVINIEKLSDNREDLTDEEKQLVSIVASVSAAAMNNANIFELTRDELASEKKISAQQAEEKKKIRDIFSKYTSPAVMELVLKNPESLKLGGQKRTATVFFSDIRSFTTYSEKYPPERVVSILNEYLSAMTDIIMEHNGTIDKYVGDEIMALWGVPVEQPDHPRMAVKAAWAMLNKLKELQEQWKKRGIEPFDIGMGINTGEMIAGNMGSDKRMDYTVIGDQVNAAARIESLTRQFNCHLLISEFTYDLVKDIVTAQALGHVAVKGKENKILVYRVNDVKL